jgi:hypothetical protein
VTPGTQYTTLPTSSVTEEEPFLYTDAQGSYHVFVPAVQHNSSGPSWASGTEAGRSIPILTFFVASPSTPAAAINVALARGRNLIPTPGVYDLDQPIVVSRPDTVVMGLGFATLVPQHGNAAMIVTANTGVKLSGLIVDAALRRQRAFGRHHPGQRPGRRAILGQDDQFPQQPLGACGDMIRPQGTLTG